jgi:hypothetical protein
MLCICFTKNLVKFLITWDIHSIITSTILFVFNNILNIKPTNTKRTNSIQLFQWLRVIWWKMYTFLSFFPNKAFVSPWISCIAYYWQLSDECFNFHQFSPRLKQKTISRCFQRFNISNAAWTYLARYYILSF